MIDDGFEKVLQNKKYTLELKNCFIKFICFNISLFIAIFRKGDEEEMRGKWVLITIMQKVFIDHFSYNEMFIE